MRTSFDRLVRREDSRAFVLLFAFLAVNAAALIAVLTGWLETLPGFVALLTLTALGLLLGRDALAQAEVAGRHRRGQRAEHRVRKALDEMQRDGWLVTHDVLKDRGGNIDHVVSGPNAVFAIETKANAYRLEDLVQARRNAAWLGGRQRRWVTPVLCLANRDDAPSERDGVWIVGLRRLPDWLERSAEAAN